MSNEISVVNQNLPAHLQQGQGGFAKDESGLLAPPIIKLIQKSSEEFDKGLAKQGQFFNTSTQEATNELYFVPLAAKREWVSYTKDKKLEFKTSSEEEAKARFGDDHWKYKNLTFLILPEGGSMPAILTFKASSFKTGQKLYQMAKAANPRCMFTKGYKLTAEIQAFPEGPAAVPSVNFAPGRQNLTDDRGYILKDVYDVAAMFAKELSL